MKLIQLTLALAISGVLLTGCKQTDSAPKEANESAAVTEKVPVPTARLETASFTIDGMTCAVGCAKTIEKKLSGMDGVQKATVDFDKKTATVAFDKEKQTPETLVKAVEATADGKTYKVSNVHSSGDHAMLMDHEKEKSKKKRGDKGCTKDSKDGKPACCAKKHCTEEKA